MLPVNSWQSWTEWDMAHFFLHFLPGYRIPLVLNWRMNSNSWEIVWVRGAVALVSRAYWLWRKLWALMKFSYASVHHTTIHESLHFNLLSVAQWTVAFSSCWNLHSETGEICVWTFAYTNCYGKCCW